MVSITERIAVFDLDGTLIDSAPDICDALNHARRLRGQQPLELADVRPMIGGGLRSLMVQSGTVIDDNGMDESRAAFVQYYAEHLFVDTKPYPGVQAMLKRRERVGLVTNKPRRFGEPILEALEWSFEVVIFGDDGVGRKPDAAPLEYAMQRLSIGPQEMVFVGDTDLDVQAGLAANVETWLVPWASQHLRHKRLRDLTHLDTILSRSQKGYQ